MLEKLESILSLKQTSNDYDWKRVEDMFDIQFPSDYKRFIDNYGEGAMNDFLWILSPFSEYENLNTVNKFNEMKDAYEAMKKELPEICEFEFWENGKGLFPWGITDNGDELFWNYTENYIDIVIFSSRYADKQVYRSGAVEFLIGLLEKEKKCSIFPDDFIRDENYYEL